jgi:YHS domain-containing protein
MGKRVAFIITMLLVVGGACAQSDSTKGFVHKGILRAGLNFAIGKMTAFNISNAYVTGNIEYYADSKISVRGDVYFFANSLNNNKFIKQNNALYFGSCYNFPTHSHFDPIIGLQPGVALSQLNPVAGSDVPNPVNIAPIASIITGFNYYAENWFHIQVNVRYTMGKHLDEDGLFQLNEISFSFGLGFNIDVLKKST